MKEKCGLIVSALQSCSALLASWSRNLRESFANTASTSFSLKEKIRCYVKIDFPREYHIDNSIVTYDDSVVPLCIIHLKLYTGNIDLLKIAWQVKNLLIKRVFDGPHPDGFISPWPEYQSNLHWSIQVYWRVTRFLAVVYYNCGIKTFQSQSCNI